MNPRSIHFRLTVYQVSLMALALLFFSLASYWGFRRHLIRALEAQCASHTRQIAESLLASLPVSGMHYVQNEIQEHYAPEVNNVFLRIVISTGTIVYESGGPNDGSFSPPELGFLAGRKEPQTVVDFRNHRLVFVRPYFLSNGDAYQIQMVASLSPLEKSLDGLWKTGMIVLPFVLAASFVGGFFLTKRSLSTVREIIATSQKITSSNLTERLVEKQTGDEIEALTKTLNRMLERLEASFKQMTRFTADASHELRTPLTVIRGNLELLLRHRQASSEKLCSEDAREILTQTLEETERLSKIVGQLMELAQLDSGEIELDQEVFDLPELVASTVDQMQPLAEDKQVRLQTELRPGILFKGDRYRVKQVLLNLIDNGIKYCPAGSQICVGLFQGPGNATLEVLDNGPGIDADSLKHLFDRFYRIDKARSRELGGSGLGLSICKSICEAHGGSIEVESRPGVGSTFRVLLPLEDQA